jgi:hypothetical protein
MQKCKLEKINHYRDRLNSETSIENRKRLQGMLIEEEDAFGASLALLNDLDGHIADGQKRIERQRGLVSKMNRNDSSFSLARAVLDGMLETQELHETYRRLVLIRIMENQLLRLE